MLVLYFPIITTSVLCWGECSRNCLSPTLHEMICLFDPASRVYVSFGQQETAMKRLRHESICAPNTRGLLIQCFFFCREVCSFMECKRNWLPPNHMCVCMCDLYHILLLYHASTRRILPHFKLPPPAANLRTLRITPTKRSGSESTCINIVIVCGTHGGQVLRPECGLYICCVDITLRQTPRTPSTWIPQGDLVRNRLLPILQLQLRAGRSPELVNKQFDNTTSNRINPSSDRCDICDIKN